MPHSFCCKRSQSGRAAARMIVAGPFKARTGGKNGFRRGSDDWLNRRCPRRIACLPIIPDLKGRPKFMWPLCGQNDLKNYAALGGTPALPGRKFAKQRKICAPHDPWIQEFGFGCFLVISLVPARPCSTRSTAPIETLASSTIWWIPALFIWLTHSKSSRSDPQNFRLP